jgi:hypothetical protein
MTPTKKVTLSWFQIKCVPRQSKKLISLLMTWMFVTHETNRTHHFGIFIINGLFSRAAPGFAWTGARGEPL